MTTDSPLTQSKLSAVPLELVDVVAKELLHIRSEDGIATNIASRGTKTCFSVTTPVDSSARYVCMQQEWRKEAHSRVGLDATWSRRYW